MQVTEEDGGRLNAFAKEPRMEVMEVGESSSANSKLLLIGGAVLVLLLVGFFGLEPLGVPVSAGLVVKAASPAVSSLMAAACVAAPVITQPVVVTSDATRQVPG